MMKQEHNDFHGYYVPLPGYLQVQFFFVAK